MKNLANCKPSEFLRQANKIRKSVQKWLDLTDILSIRVQMPELEKITVDMSVEEKAAVQEKNRLAVQRKTLDNAMEILDVVMDKYPDETLELLALLCFIEPKDADTHTTGEYLTAFAELMSDQAVIDFFMSLARLGQMGSSMQ